MPGPQSKQRSEHSDALTALSPEQSRRQLRCCFGPIIHRKTGATGEHLTEWRPSASVTASHLCAAGGSIVREDDVVGGVGARQIRE